MECELIIVKCFIRTWEQEKLKNVVITNPYEELPEKFNYVNLESVLGTSLISYECTNIENAPSRAQRLAKKGDIFFQNVRPYQKNNLLFNLDCSNYVFSTGYTQLRPKLNSGFLFSIIQKNKFVNKVLNRCTGSSYPAISSKDLVDIKVNISRNIEEQNKIADFIGTIDKLLTLHKRKIELELKYVEALKESFIPYSEQIQKSFNNIEYRVVKLEDILKERKETNVPNDEYPLVSFTADEGVTKKTERYNREFLVRKSEKKYKKTLYNDLVYNPANLKFGAINRNTFGNAVFSPIYITFTTNQDSEYLEYVFTQWNFINKALKYQEGTVYERSSVKPKDFLKIKLAIPNDINDQKFIASLIDQKLIATNKSKAFLKKLEKLKDYYLKDLFI
ncbi:hypothetical protein HMPREF2767_08225 [Nosocomiicoccus sp. HMSC067E10]|uniref:restriction endonuclease subunit S n=1 Tax=Nosocomiicoccus sp. HMSC067E10 TaxID=1739271 RepID=UPI0008A4CB1A|nr:restriction endonuclease subunit S [Nosocomiicoccus sp. HMSC067E10]OFL48251.1 hypothetical protein HMPREF2767_08225 [Nosocomiicoccus sp. HMSC067E10]